MKPITIIQIIVALLLAVSIILQNRGTDSGMVGGGGQTYRSKKGLERLLFYATVVLAVIFASVSILSVLV